MICYSLADPRSGAVRYVGRSQDPEARLRQNLSNPHSKRLAKWFDELANEGLTPALSRLEGDHEKAWIERLRPDLNVNEGDTELPPRASAHQFKIRIKTSLYEQFEARAKARGVSLASVMIAATSKELGLA